jgi:hypothetical protein
MTEEKEKKHILLRFTFINGMEEEKILIVDNEFDLLKYNEHLSECLTSKTKWINFIESDSPPITCLINKEEIISISLSERKAPDPLKTHYWSDTTMKPY